MLRLWPHRVSLNLLFIHIHKTGGKSISKILDDTYGGAHFRINRSYLKRNDLPHLTRSSKEIPRKTKVLSGHLRYLEIQKTLRKNTRVFTWLRHPVDRVISNYYWRLNMNHTKSVDPENPMSNPNLSLEDFVNYQENQNWMSFFLEGIKLEDLFFIGFLESFNDDIDRLGSLLGWYNAPKYHINKNTSFKPERPQIEPAMRKRIAELNAVDMAMYEKAKKLMSEGKA